MRAKESSQVILVLSNGKDGSTIDQTASVCINSYYVKDNTFLNSYQKVKYLYKNDIKTLIRSFILIGIFIHK